MSGIFNALLIEFPTSRGMQRRVKTLKSNLNETIEHLDVTGSSVNLIIEVSFHTKRFARDVAKGVSETFPHATVWFLNSSDSIGTRRKFNPSLLEATTRSNKR